MDEKLEKFINICANADRQAQDQNNNFSSSVRTIIITTATSTAAISGFEHKQIGKETHSTSLNY